MIKILVPPNSDSLLNATLNGVFYGLKLAFNEEGQYWSLGVYDDAGDPIIERMKIVPNFPINRYFPREDMPQGVFTVYTMLERLTKDSFTNGEAELYFIPYNEIPEEDMAYAK